MLPRARLDRCRGYASVVVTRKAWEVYAYDGPEGPYGPLEEYLSVLLVGEVMVVYAYDGPEGREELG